MGYLGWSRQSDLPRYQSCYVKAKLEPIAIYRGECLLPILPFPYPTPQSRPCPPLLLHSHIYNNPLHRCPSNKKPTCAVTAAAISPSAASVTVGCEDGSLHGLVVSPHDATVQHAWSTSGAGAAVMAMDVSEDGKVIKLPRRMRRVGRVRTNSWGYSPVQQLGLHVVLTGASGLYRHLAACSAYPVHLCFVG